MNRLTLLVLFALLLRVDTAFAQSLNIDIEGPWIYYVDDEFKGDNGQPESVLIAMAPYVENHVASFGAGDGFAITQPGVYCVGFDELCAPVHNGNKPSFPGKLLRVKAPSGWYWHDVLDKKAIYLILPIPDAYSNDGVYRLKFGSKFGKPQYYGPEKKQSIGLFLHYANGPYTINLSSNCKTPSTNSCTFDGSFQDQDNSGTLRISMKAPDDPSDYCDMHVRQAYHRMLLAIHSGSLQNSGNVNQDHGYIDLPDYNATCYQKDPQDDGNIEASTKHVGEVPSVVNVSAQLNKIVADLRKPELERYRLLLPELAEEAKLLRIKEDEPSIGKVPIYSQMNHIQLLLSLSMKAIDDQFTTDASPRSALKVARDDEEALANYAMYIRSAISGKDCRVAEMLIQ